MSKTIVLYGGSFKPVTRGHVSVVEQTYKEIQHIDEFIIFVGEGERDKVDQTQSLLVWEIYKKHLPKNIKIEPCKAPIGDIIRFIKANPQDQIYWVLGAREGKEDDQKDIASRTDRIKDKYPNLTIKVITTSDEGMSGSNARKTLKQGLDELKPYLPTFLSEDELNEVWDILGQVNDKQPLNENATYSKDIDYKQQIKDLTKYMLNQGKNIKPLPKVIFKHSNSSNAQNFFGKTAYYDPNSVSIVLYTEGRHPKDIVRSFSHEMVHHTQNLENRLGNIYTTNTTEDNSLLDLEKEAYLEGNITFRNWTDSTLLPITSKLPPSLVTENLSSNNIYHFTSYRACQAILQSNKIKSSPSEYFFEYDINRILPEYKNVIFFTKHKDRFVSQEPSDECALVIDKKKLFKDFKGINYDGVYEEVVIYTNEPFIPILPYVKSVILYNTLQKAKVKKLITFLEKENIPYKVNNDLENQITKDKKNFPFLKKQLIKNLNTQYPKGFIGYWNTPLPPQRDIKSFPPNSTIPYPSIIINQPGESSKKNNFQVLFFIPPTNLEENINWYIHSGDNLKDLVNLESYDGAELYLKGDIKIYKTEKSPEYKVNNDLEENITFRNWTDSLNNPKSNLDEAKQDIKDNMLVISHKNGNELILWDTTSKEVLGVINTFNNEVTGVAAKKGYGPLLYELGMANVYPNGLQSDRNGNTTPAAENIWKKFISLSPPNIKIKKLDKNDKLYKSHYGEEDDGYYDSSFIPEYFNFIFYNSNTLPLKTLIKKGESIPKDLRKFIILKGEEFYDSLVNEEYSPNIKKDYFGLNEYTHKLVKKLNSINEY